LGALSFIGCRKDKLGDNRTYEITGGANGTQEIPFVSTAGIAGITGTYNAKTNELNYKATWSNLSAEATMAGFYSGPLGKNGTLVSEAAITTAGADGVAEGKIKLSNAQESALLDGTWYYTVCTSKHMEGEVRGQVITLVQE
jgi:hypothetical protein